MDHDKGSNVTLALRDPLTYGELLPGGLSKVVSSDRLNATTEDCQVAFELGMGSGKVALQLFTQCPNLKLVVGIELAQVRHQIGVAALERIAKCRSEFAIKRGLPGPTDAKLEQGDRTLEFRLGSFFDLDQHEIAKADFIILEVFLTDIQDLLLQLNRLLNQVKDGCRLLMLDQLETTWIAEEPCIFHVIPPNRTEADRYATSWSSKQGTHLHLYIADRTLPPEITADSAANRRKQNTMLQVGGVALAAAGVALCNVM
eukprot:gnl/MRDRNA2_/MRDRNA2_167145_c0_seq1.p1 gnl/MRDRNA2_/MRDRNA2_167145_c0~~gnl/MRDRNA2_/MRDRNA2_167145_c0_seq1.p1  ORF type:complete len:279 (-),score=50.02 gnl/MRDRNA2_/MRDRNA2_167145_c0_seq1:134-907(-)